MAEQVVVQWQNSYSVGIKLVYEQHMELIRLTNKLFLNCLGSHEETINAFVSTIHEVVDYTGYHFGTEEMIMNRVRYPDFQIHKKEHENFVREVFSKVEDFKAGKIFVPIQFVYFLRDWVLHHIAVSEKRLGTYLLALKKSGTLHKMTVMAKKDESTNRMFVR